MTQATTGKSTGVVQPTVEAKPKPQEHIQVLT